MRTIHIVNNDMIILTCVYLRGTKETLCHGKMPMRMGSFDLISNWVWGLAASMHLGFDLRAHCAPYQSIGALLPCQSSSWPPDLYS
jgi:hypothetical protein